MVRTPNRSLFIGFSSAALVAGCAADDEPAATDFEFPPITADAGMHRNDDGSPSVARDAATADGGSDGSNGMYGLGVEDVPVLTSIPVSSLDEPVPTPRVTGGRSHSTSRPIRVGPAAPTDVPTVANNEPLVPPPSVSRFRFTRPPTDGTSRDWAGQLAPLDERVAQLLDDRERCPTDGCREAIRARIVGADRPDRRALACVASDVYANVASALRFFCEDRALDELCAFHCRQARTGYARAAALQPRASALCPARQPAGITDMAALYCRTHGGS